MAITTGTPSESCHRGPSSLSSPLHPHTISSPCIMAATASNSWIPPAGRFDVQVGASLGRALRTRKSGPPPKNNKLPDRDFYSFRCKWPTDTSVVEISLMLSCADNFIPESVDTAKPGTIEVKKSSETTAVTVERASTQVRCTAEPMVVFKTNPDSHCLRPTRALTFLLAKRQLRKKWSACSSTMKK